MTGSRLMPSPALAAALDTYGRAFCRAAHLDTSARRAALADAEQAVLRVVEADAEQVPATVERDDGPRLHIPRDLLDGAGG